MPYVNLSKEHLGYDTSIERVAIWLYLHLFALNLAPATWSLTEPGSTTNLRITTINYESGIG